MLGLSNLFANPQFLTLLRQSLAHRARRAGVLLDSRQDQIVMYLIPPGDLARKLAPIPKAENSMIGVAITTKKPESCVHSALSHSF